MNDLRIGILGCGGIANHHVRGYQAAGASVAVACDIHEPAAQKLAQGTGARVARSVEELLEDKPDAVSVCTPPGAHRAACVPLLERGVPVLCEKPLAGSLEDAEAIAAAAEKSGTPLMVGFCHRFHGPIIELKRLIDAGTLGEPVLFRNIFGGFLRLEGNHRLDPALSGGGVLIDNGTHSVDLFRHLVGEVEQVQAVAAHAVQDVPVDDLALMHLSGAGGKRLGEITGAYSLKVCGNWVEWYGTRGTALVSYGNVGQPDLSYRVEGEKHWTPVDCTAHRPRFETEIRQFLAAVRKEAPPATTARDGLAASRIIAAAYESSRRGQRVRV